MHKQILLACGFFFTVIGTNVPAWAYDGSKMIVAFNERILKIADAEDGFLTLKGLRATAMMHLAMHDVFNTVQPRYERFAFKGDGPLANPIAAAAHAAYAVAVDQYPDQQQSFDEELNNWLDDLSPAAETLGQATAQAVLGRRLNDGWNTKADYRWHPMGPGVYAEFSEHSGTPKGFIFGAGWASARPFALQSPDQLRVAPPPPIESEDYAIAFAEVKEVGRRDSATRTGDQSHLAMWWKDFVERSHNRLARSLILQKNLHPHEAARMMALLNVSIYDAYVSSFDSKFHYNHWRPVTAIRMAESDGNPATNAEPKWTNLHNHTYAFPSYPSAHGTACAAAMTAISNTFGDELAFSMTTPVVDSAGPFSEKIKLSPATRSFERFSDAAMECAMSRVYLGIHFRYDSIVGNRLGRSVGHEVISTLLRHLPG